MPDHSVRKAADLAVDERVIVERWLGRPLAHDQTISLDISRPVPQPSDEERQKAWKRALGTGA